MGVPIRRNGRKQTFSLARRESKLDNV